MREVEVVEGEEEEQEEGLQVEMDEGEVLEELQVEGVEAEGLQVEEAERNSFMVVGARARASVCPQDASLFPGQSEDHVWAGGQDAAVVKYWDAARRATSMAPFRLSQPAAAPRREP
ncbi:unnamed protein product [Merluccius merluccius]